jgi:hypothetical protein
MPPPIFYPPPALVGRAKRDMLGCPPSAAAAAAATARTLTAPTAGTLEPRFRAPSLAEQTRMSAVTYAPPLPSSSPFILLPLREQLLEGAVCHFLIFF